MSTLIKPKPKPLPQPATKAPPPETEVIRNPVNRSRSRSGRPGTIQSIMQAGLAPKGGSQTTGGGI